MNYRLQLGSVFFVTVLGAAACERTTSPPAVADASLTVNIQTLSPPETPAPPPPSPPVNITNMNGIKVEAPARKNSLVCD